MALEPRTEDLLAALAAARGASCARCAAPVCGHEFLTGFALGFRDEPRCLACLALEVGQPVETIREQFLGYVQSRDCYRAGWARASLDEGFDPASPPPCLGEGPPGASSTAGGDDGPPGASWDAGDLGCGGLVLELRRRMMALVPGTVLEVRATDPGAPEDLPAWCRLTGHALVAARPPLYRIQKKKG